MVSASNRPWWSGGVRMYHPNMGDLDVRDMDFDRFVAEAVSLHASSVVISAAGVVAYYPTAIPGHHVSEYLNGRDFVGEVSRRLADAGLLAIARVDFAGARRPVFEAHPDWVARDATGAPAQRGDLRDLYTTCPTSPYRREGFAVPVVRELLSRYPIAGFHVNAGGWSGRCFCGHCQESFRAATGQPLPIDRAADPELWARYVEWRYERVADYFRVLREAARAAKPDVFWMGELALRPGSYDLPTLAPACSALLITTGNVVGAERSVRSWSGLAARYARTADRGAQPLLNLKVFVKGTGGWPRSMVPPAEYRLWLWQALANGAGLKTPVYGTLAQADRRNLPSIRDAFVLMERHPEVYSEARPVAPVALVWPRRTFDHWSGPSDQAGGKATSGADLATAAFNGLYDALVELHVPFEVLADGHLTPERLIEGGYRALALPCAACLGDAAVAAIGGFVERGGGVLATGWTGWADELGRPRAAPALAGLGGVVALDRAALAGPGLYLAPGEASESEPILAGLEGVGLITADGPAPFVASNGSGAAALRLVKQAQVLTVEANDLLIDTGCAGLVLSEVGKGRIATLVAPADALYWRWGLVDHRRLLGNLVDWCAGVDGAGGPWPLETGAPDTVEVTLARSPRRLAVHFVNATGAAPLRGVIPVRLSGEPGGASPAGEAPMFPRAPAHGRADLVSTRGVGRTRVLVEPGERVTSGRRLIDGQAVEVSQRGRVVELDPGEVGEYEVVVLEVTS